MQVPGAGPLPGDGDDEGVHVLAPAFVGSADDDGLGDAWVAFQDVLDLGRVDVLTGDEDGVLDAVADEDVTVLVDVAGVPGVDPAVDEGLGGLVWQPQYSTMRAGVARQTSPTAPGGSSRPSVSITLLRTPG